jgi:hypothetical protein
MQTPTGIDISNYDSDKSSTGHGSSDNTDLPSSSSVTTAGDVESGTGSVQTKDLRDTIIKKEEKSVRKARRLVGVAVITCAIAVSVLVYMFAKKGDQKAFEIQVSFRGGKHAESLAKCMESRLMHCTLLASPVRRVCERHHGFGGLGSTIQLCTDGAVKV